MSNYLVGMPFNSQPQFEGWLAVDMDWPSFLTAVNQRPVVLQDGTCPVYHELLVPCSEV